MINQTIGYAITALGCMATMGKPALVMEVAECTDLPRNYLAKIINTLARKGFVGTQRGIGGRVTLAKEPKDISMYDICLALDDPLVNKRCMLGTAECSDERACPCHQFWSTHRDQALDFLRKTSLSDMAEFEAAVCLPLGSGEGVRE